jgi:hypothetical protein
MLREVTNYKFRKKRKDFLNKVNESIIKYSFPYTSQISPAFSNTMFVGQNTVKNCLSKAFCGKQKQQKILWSNNFIQVNESWNSDHFSMLGAKAA